MYWILHIITKGTPYSLDRCTTIRDERKPRELHLTGLTIYHSLYLTFFIGHIYSSSDNVYT